MMTNHETKNLEKHNDRMAKVHHALEIMQTYQMAINFQSVARFAGVAKSWLYAHDALSTKIKSLRAQGGKIRRNAQLLVRLKQKTDEIEKLNQRLNTSQHENQRLKDQIEKLYAELYMKQQ